MPATPASATPSPPPHIPGIAADDRVVTIYLAALRHPRLHARHLQDDGFEPAEIDSAMRVLAREGLVTATGGDQWQVAPPDVSLPSLAARHEERARSLRQTAPALARWYAEGQQSAAPSLGGAEALTSVASVDRAVQQVVAGASTTVHLVHRGSPYLRSLLDAGPERYRRTLVNSLGHPVHSRVVFDARLLGDDRLHPILQAREEAGDDQRSARSLPLSAYVNDTGTAVLDLEDDRGNAVGFILTGRSGAHTIERFALWVWQMSIAWRSGTTPSRDMATFAGRDRQILRLLAAGAPDSTVARQLRISQRTVERRVRVILDRLNAVNRFQAGVIATRRGLL